MISKKNLARCFSDKLKQQFPEIEFVGIAESVENPNNLRVKIIIPKYAKDLVDKNALPGVQESISIGKQILQRKLAAS